MEINGENVKVVEVTRCDGGARLSCGGVRSDNYESKRCLPNSSVKHENAKRESSGIESCPRVTSSPLTNFKLPSENRHNMLISQQYEQPLEREKVLAHVESKEIQEKPNWHSSKEKSILKEGVRKSNEIQPDKILRDEEKMEAKAKCLDPKNHTRNKTSTIQSKHTQGYGKKEVPPAIFQLMNDVINVVSFKCSIDNNIKIVDELELHQQQGWQVEIERRKRKVVEQRNAARKRVRMTEMKRNERLKRLTKHNRYVNLLLNIF